MTASTAPVAVGPAGTALPGRRPQARTLLLVSAAMITIYSTTNSNLSSQPGFRLLPLTAATVLAGWALIGRPLPVPARLAGIAEWLAVGLLSGIGLLVSAGVLAYKADSNGVRWLVALVPVHLVLGALALLPADRLPGRLRRRLGARGRPDVVLLAAFLAVHAVLMVVLLRHSPVEVDVHMFQHDASRALLHGHDPYAITYQNIYPHSLTQIFYGPGVVVDGRIAFGFPYPPVGLIAAFLGYLLGDVRYAMLASMLVAALLLRLLARDAVTRAVAPAVAVAPVCVGMVLGDWSEPLLVGLLAAGVHAAVRGRRWAPYLLGLTFVGKQYLVGALPLLWLLRAGRRSLAAAPAWSRPAAWTGAGRWTGWLLRGAVGAAVVTVPFLLWQPVAFFRSLVVFHLKQPFRADSISILVWSVDHFGWPPPSVYGWLPIVVGLLVAVLVARRGPRTPAGLSAGIGVVLLVTVLLSKQAYTNYYYFALGALVIAACAWPDDEVDPASSDQLGQAEARQAPGPGTAGARIA